MIRGIRTSHMAALAALQLLAHQSVAQNAASGLEEVVVTAQKRSEDINSVPMSVTAISGDQLQALGISDMSQLAKSVPGFTYADSSYGTPIYFIRGIGFFDTSLASKPTVGVYVDEVPLAFPAMTLGAVFDLERVEVLKGPQGTLFGQNATGGAINYIAAKPTDAFDAGVDLGAGNFGSYDVGGFLSGPLSDTFRARFAVKHSQSDGWQKSMTRPGDTLGAKDFTQARMILEWRPLDALTLSLNVNGFIDKSETQAPQFTQTFQQTAGAFLDPRLPTYPRAINNARQADWGYHSEYDLDRDNQLWQSTLRADYEITDDVTLTSLTSYSDFDQEFGQDGDGTALNITDLYIVGQVESFTQELRVAGNMDRGNWVVGVNYSRDTAFEQDDQRLTNASSGHAFDRLGLPPTDLVPQIGSTKFESAAVFANMTYEIVQDLNLQLGARYTDTDIDFSGCALNGGNQTFARGFSLALGYAGTIPLGECVTFSSGTPSVPQLVVDSKSESNVSWRTGLDWNVTADTLLYANISRGYKAGGYPTLPGTNEPQYSPVDQEKITAYEVGIKATLFERTLQLNGAVFYNDYVDKQLKGRTIVPVFGPLEALVNIPKSKVQGAELQINWAPISGLRLGSGITYLDTEVTEGSPGGNYTVFGGAVRTNLKGSEFPYMSEWQISADGEYSFGLTNSLDGFVGVGANYRSKSNGDFLPDPRLDIDAYTLVDVRLGVASSDDKWRATLYGRNITDEYYWVTANRRTDSVVRYAGMPRTYGISLAYRY